ncbi:DUF998 domain-containing protein [Streptomyces sp. NPDC048362]|uniref:DUF998 domain-containing protein n=1 Tax=Streptomyces sp. NPDC048362 TaxID=3365539 RepID=UPI00371940B5
MIEGLPRTGFDLSRNAISQLGLGSLGRIQVAGFLITGTLVTAGAAGLRRAVGHLTGGTRAPRCRANTKNAAPSASLVGVLGASFLLAGVFTADPCAGFPQGALVLGGEVPWPTAPCRRASSPVSPVRPPRSPPSPPRQASACSRSPQSSPSGPAPLRTPSGSGSSSRT